MKSLLFFIKFVPAPYNDSDPRSYYDYLVDWYADDELSGDQTEPEVFVVGSGSDHGTFIFVLGVPVIDLGYDVDAQLYPGLRDKQYPAYHTGYMSTPCRM